MGENEEIAKLEEEILLGEMGDDLFYVRGEGRMLRQKLRCALARLNCGRED
jgi:hypothetical protein